MLFNATFNNISVIVVGVIVDYVAIDSYGGVLILHVQLQANLRL
jgi:hypothetical protein